MNKAQKILTISALLVFVATLLFFPSELRYDNFHPFWMIHHLNMAQAYIEWIAIGVIYFGLRALLASPRK